MVLHDYLCVLYLYFSEKFTIASHCFTIKSYQNHEAYFISLTSSLLSQPVTPVNKLLRVQIYIFQLNTARGGKDPRFIDLGTNKRWSVLCFGCFVICGKNSF